MYVYVDVDVYVNNFFVMFYVLFLEPLIIIVVATHTPFSFITIIELN